jgi:hypothetical protein
METTVRRRPVAVRYFAVSILFLIIGLRFYATGDQIGTVIYGVTTTGSLLAGCVQFLRKV